MESELEKYVINLNEVDEELQKYAKEHINEDPDTNLQIVSEFRDYIYERGECIPARIDDAFLLRFLRARNFVIRRAHRLLVNHCNFKEKNEDLYDIKFERLEHFLKSGVFTCMPFCDENNRRICIFRPCLWNPDEIPEYEFNQFFLFSLEVFLWEPRAQIAGGVGIFDLTNSSLRHALFFTPSNVNKILHLLLWSYPLRTHKIHVVNETSVFNIGINLLRPFLSSDIQNALVFHGNDTSSLHEHISPKYLPERYGGIHPDYCDAYWLDILASRKEFLDELTKSGYNIGKELCSRAPM